MTASGSLSFILPSYRNHAEEATTDNAIVVPSHYSADHHGYDYLIGEGKALDPKKQFIIATNMFGNGLSSSPSNTPAPFEGPNFPEISIRDNVRASHALLTKGLGLNHLKAVVGYSMGGQQAYQWAVSYPAFMDAVIVICGTAKEYPFGIARLEGAKGAIMGDTAWDGGKYKAQPKNGLGALGRHWAAWAYSPEWWRREEYVTARRQTLKEALAGWKEAFVSKDANDLLSQATTWQKHDVGDERQL